LGFGDWGLGMGPKPQKFTKINVIVGRLANFLFKIMN
jgi:hypothetical protein